MTRECPQCDRWSSEKYERSPASSGNIIRGTVEITILCLIITAILSLGALCIFGILIQKMMPLSYTLYILGTVSLVAILVIIYNHGRTFYRNNIVGTEVVWCRDEDDNFHEHKRCDNNLDEEFLAFRHGGYFRRVGILSPSRRRDWKVISSWSSRELILEDQEGGRITNVDYGMTPELIFDLTKAPALSSFLDRQRRQIEQLKHAQGQRNEEARS